MSLNGPCRSNFTAWDNTVEHILCVEGTARELSFVRGLEHYDPVADHKFIKLYRKLPGPGKERMVDQRI